MPKRAARAVLGGSEHADGIPVKVDKTRREMIAELFARGFQSLRDVGNRVDRASGGNSGGRWDDGFQFHGLVDVHQLFEFLNILFVRFLSLGGFHLLDQANQLFLIVFAALVPVAEEFH